MSRDSSPTYLHLHASSHADLFEEFCRPPSSSSGSNPSASLSNGNPTSNPNNSANPSDSNSLAHIPGSFLPYEEIHLPPHLMPVNPEDEDDVVPDMHAAFGINRALGRGGPGGGGTGGGGEGGRGQGEMSSAGAVREVAWRDLGLEGLLDGGAGGTGEGMGDVRSTVGGMGEGARPRGGGVNGSGVATGLVAGGRREGRRTGVLLLR